jgi:hypothetical protein
MCTIVSEVSPRKLLLAEFVLNTPTFTGEAAQLGLFAKDGGQL